jgi:hypothetical protein
MSLTRSKGNEAFVKKMRELGRTFHDPWRGHEEQTRAGQLKLGAGIKSGAIEHPKKRKRRLTKPTEGVE